MSQNKTVVPGIGGANMQDSYGQQGFYSRSAGAAGGTVVPGMGQAAPQPAYAAAPQAAPQSHPGKPVVGFIYSVSRDAAGEYWPLYLGRNSIGSNTSCHINLREQTVSGNHAEIVVRRLQNPTRVIAGVRDTGSTNGTCLNGQGLAFEAVACKSGDIISVGASYELLLILVDAEEIGLSPAPNFMPMDEAEEPQNPTFGFMGGGYNPAAGGYNPAAGGYSPYQANPNDPHVAGGTSDGTVGFDGSTGPSQGGTQIL